MNNHLFIVYRWHVLSCLVYELFVMPSFFGIQPMGCVNSKRSLHRALGQCRSAESWRPVGITMSDCGMERPELCCNCSAAWRPNLVALVGQRSAQMQRTYFIGFGSHFHKGHRVSRCSMTVHHYWPISCKQKVSKLLPSFHIAQFCPLYNHFPLHTLTDWRSNGLN